MSDNAKSNAKAWLESVREMVAALNAAKGNDEDEARQTIYEAPLSVQVRGGWYNPGDEEKGGKAEEFEILLTTGGPALRIIGQLDQYGEPDQPRVQYQDWGIPWTDYRETSDEDEAALLTFCRCFYFRGMIGPAILTALAALAAILCAVEDLRHP